MGVFQILQQPRTCVPVGSPLHNMCAQVINMIYADINIYVYFNRHVWYSSSMLISYPLYKMAAILADDNFKCIFLN